MKKKLYQKLKYIYNNNLTKMPKIVTEISFLKNSINIKSDFYKTCTLNFTQIAKNV